MPKNFRQTEFHTDLIPYWGLPLLVIHFFMIGAFFAAQYYLFPVLDSAVLKDFLTGLLNPSLLVISFYIGCLIYLFTKRDCRRPRRFILSMVFLAGLATAFNIHLPDVQFPEDIVARYFVMLAGSGFGTLLCVFYRHTFCGDIATLV